MPTYFALLLPPTHLVTDLIFMTERGRQIAYYQNIKKHLQFKQQHGAVIAVIGDFNQSS